MTEELSSINAHLPYVELGVLFGLQPANPAKIWLKRQALAPAAEKH